MALPYISAMIALPALAALVSLLGPWSRTQARWIAIGSALITFLISLAVLLSVITPFLDLGLQPDPTGTFVAYEEYLWFRIGDLPVFFRVGVDGLSLPLVFLTGLLFLVAVIFPMEEAYKPKEYYALLQVISLALIGVFISLDFLQFFVFWELVLIPMYFLINIWGGPNKHYAAIKFLIFTHVGGVIMLVGIFFLVSSTGTLNMIEIIQRAPLLPLSLQVSAFVAFLIGFGVKLPMVPLHTWLPDAHVEAPTAGSVILAGVLLKMGGYGIFRVAYSMLPGAAVELWWLVAILGVVSMIYASLVCLAQVDLKRLIAYSSIGHMGFVLLGASTITAVGVAGAIFQLFNHGLVTAVLFMLAGAVKHATGSRLIPHLRGLGSKMPIFAFILILSFLASLGLPGLNTFVSEFMVFVGTYAGLPEGQKILVIIPLLAVVLAGAYYLWTMQRVLMGSFNVRLGAARDLHLDEYLPMVLVAVLIVLTGLFPAIWIDQIYPFSQVIEGSVALAGGG